MTGEVDVLVVGAGPTGLATALMARHHGARVRIVERRTTAFRPSRAMILHSRALESLRPLGVTEGLLDRADVSPTAKLYAGARSVSARLAQVDLPGTPFPPMVLIRQMDVEEVLTRALEEAGVVVERGTALLELHPIANEHGVRALLGAAGRTEEVQSCFLAGCDGSDSTVRHCAGIGFVGGLHQEEVVLADVNLDGLPADGRLHVTVGEPGLVWLFPLGEGAPWRLLATRGANASGTSTGDAQVALDRLVQATGLAATVTGCRWSSVVALQHRLAETFQRGPVFLVGDAAHVHSPAAAQGMNSGLLDAVNLGWKLAFAARHRPAVTLLRSYDEERRPVARHVIALTRLVFFAEASTSIWARWGRRSLVPVAVPVAPHLLEQRWLMQAVFRLLSQRWVRYRNSPLSVRDGRFWDGPLPGDRLPDRDVTAAGRVRRLHALTSCPGIHLLLDRDAPTLPDAALGRWVSVHRLDGTPGHGLVAVRPDGHVGYRSADADLQKLRVWLDLVAAS
ncbi:MAG TPA: FAD-dependent monooxygenase [Segeticoccus sp.]|uniref:FAD-dependent monooxygenase n=1 Tax=Segeticoccus sp. TaxID=2706531 RepID=UPI002D7FF4FF|nr:FAD-dependent monooxygenase [Segeticoccus sp.]HET8600988.1 FAD-dependent monooxygenase [Segeticoccus sp.]